VEDRQAGVGQEVDRLRAEVVGLQASRRRLALTDDAERRRFERELHQGVQQHLVVLAANLQLVSSLIGTIPPEMAALLDEVRRDVEQALSEAQMLAQRIYPPLLDSGGLAVAIRSVAASRNVPTRVNVDPHPICPPEIARVVYICCEEVFERSTRDTQAAVTVHNAGTAIAFEIVADCHNADLETVRLRDRVESLGGQLTIRSQPGGRTRVAGSMPLPE
jgi:signal transduction histidine kinase